MACRRTAPMRSSFAGALPVRSRVAEADCSSWRTKGVGMLRAHQLDDGVGGSACASSDRPKPEMAHVRLAGAVLGAHPTLEDQLGRKHRAGDPVGLADDEIKNLQSV